MYYLDIILATGNPFSRPALSGRHIAQDSPAAAVELVDLLLKQARLLDHSRAWAPAASVARARWWPIRIT